MQQKQIARFPFELNENQFTAGPSILPNRVYTEFNNRQNTFQLDNNEGSIGLKSVIPGMKAVLEQFFPVYGKSLKRNRDWGLQALLNVHSELLRKAENNAVKNHDVEEVQRKERFLGKQIEYNKSKYAKDTILNSERSELLPIQVVNSLKAFDLTNIPISSKGELLCDITEDGFRQINNTRFFDFNKKGELNPLRIPRLRLLVGEKLNIDQKFLTQFPEYRILKAWVSKRSNFSNELRKIATYKNKYNDPKRMGRLIASRLTNLPKEELIPNQDIGMAKRFIHPSDMENLKFLAEEILLKNTIKPIATRQERVRNIFNKYLKSGKLLDFAKRNFAGYMQTYPQEINNMNI